MQDSQRFDLERRADGAVLVRVPSRVVDGRALRDAVFAFRPGDPQFAFWDAELRSRQAIAPPTISLPPMFEADQNVG